MLPKGWHFRTFGEVVKLSKTKFYPNKSISNHKCIELEHISQETGKIIGKADTKDLASIKSIFTSGDVLFGKLRPYLKKYAFCTYNGVCSTEIWVLKSTPELFNKYLFYIVQTNSFLAEANKSAGSKMPRADWSLISGFLIKLPPLPEQTKIAQIFSTWDKAIETTEQLLNNSQQQKKALMQILLTGKKRFPKFNDAWKIFSIKQMGKVIPGGTPDTNVKEYWDGNILWMTPTDVTALNTRFISTTNRKITLEGVKNSSATIMPSGSLLVCTRATVGYMSISTTEITTNQGFKNLIPNKHFDVNFLYYLFNFFKSQFIRYACGSTFLEISKKDFEKLIFACPELREQQKIAFTLSGADDEIETIQQKLIQLKQEKKALMQQLLTGKRRVKIDNEEAAYA